MATPRNILMAVVSATMLVGCIHTRKSNVIVPDYSPTDSLNKVVDDINANNGRVTTLWSFGYFEADIAEKVEGQKEPKKSFVNGDLRLLYRAPGELRIVGEKEIVGKVFDVGSNDKWYWLTAKAGADTMWFGRYAEIDHADTRIIPIRPDLLLDVLGVSRINTNFLEQPIPMLRYNNDAHAYMIVWSERLRDRWAARKEVWYDKESKLPTLILLFDENGRIILRAYLSAHKPIVKDGPKIATQYKLFFPDTGTRMLMRLDELALESDGDPSDASFAFPAERAGVGRMIDIDKLTSPQDGSPK